MAHKNVSIILLLLVVSAGTSLSQCKEEQEALDKLQKEFGVYFVDLEKQAEKLKRSIPDTDSGGTHHVTFEVTFRPHRITFDLVEVTMRNRELSMDVPQVTMKTKSFSVPYSTIKWVVEELCCGIKTKVPQATVGMKRSSFKLPEIKMARTSIVTKIPEFTSRRKEIIFDIPEFTLESPIPTDEDIRRSQEAAAEIATAADTLNAAGLRLEKEQKEKSRVLLVNLYNCIDAELANQKVQIDQEFKRTYAEIVSAINEVRNHGMNPEAVKSDDGTTINLLKVKDDLAAANEASNKSIDQERANIQEELKEILEELGGVTS